MVPSSGLSADVMLQEGHQLLRCVKRVEHCNLALRLSSELLQPGLAQRLTNELGDDLVG